MFATRSPDPRLPPELEQEIFEHAARTIDASEYLNLLLVSKRVTTWIEPIIHQTLIFDSQETPKNLITNPPHISHGQQVRNLCIVGVDWIRATEILSDCPNITNLVIYLSEHDAGMATTVSQTRIFQMTCKMPLRQFSANFPALGLSDGCHYDFAPYPHLTHLELLKVFTNWEECQQLAGLPALTHLGCWFSSAEISSWGNQDLIKAALEFCVELKVVVVRSPPDSDSSEALFQEVSLCRALLHPKVVYVRQKLGTLTSTWLSGSKGGEDIWAYADRIVSMREKRLCDS